MWFVSKCPIHDICGVTQDTKGKHTPGATRGLLPEGGGGGGLALRSGWGGGALGVCGGFSGKAENCWKIFWPHDICLTLIGVSWG